MIHDIYCKINEFRATFISLERQFDPLDTNLDKMVAQLPKEFAPVMPIIREHAACIPKARKKLPAWVRANCIFAKTPYEQCTAEDIANFRASLFEPGKVLSLTGGLGVDDIAFAYAGNMVTSLDTDPCLNELFRYNAQRLQTGNVDRITTSAEEFMKNTPAVFDLLLIDPDRRSTGTRAGSQMADYSPDIFTLLQNHRQIAPVWIIKLSPMVDIRWLQTGLPEPADIWVISSGNEVKELMVIMDGKTTGTVNLARVQGKQIDKWNGKDPLVIQESDRTIFSEPSAGCIKAGFHRQLDPQNFEAANSNSTFFTGNKLLPEWLGRSFALLQTITGSLNEMKTALNKNGISKASITCREFVLGAEETRKKLGMADGGDIYLFFTGKRDKTCFVCRKIEYRD